MKPRSVRSCGATGESGCLTQEELAEQAGLIPRGIRALERGERVAPRRDAVDLLADALTLSAGCLRRASANEQRTQQTASRAGLPRGPYASCCPPVCQDLRSSCRLPLSCPASASRRNADDQSGKHPSRTHRAQ
jgi:transcriptional regulator with XRE-family HTH domain